MPYITDMLHDRNSAAPPAEERTEPVPVGAFDARKLSKALSSKIVGQQAAVDAVVRAISIAHVGATVPDASARKHPSRWPDRRRQDGIGAARGRRTTVRTR